MNLNEARALAQGNPTPEQLRAISDAALLARGWYVAKETNTFPRLWMHDETDLALRDEERPHPADDLTDAAKWMVPEGADVELRWSKGHDNAKAIVEYKLTSHESPRCAVALALTLAGWAAKQEVEK